MKVGDLIILGRLHALPTWLVVSHYRTLDNSITVRTRIVLFVLIAIA